MTLRRDGVAVVDVRATLETHDGALALVQYQGVIDLGPDGHDEFLRGEAPEVMRIRIAPRFCTGHPAYQWLNRLQCPGVGEYHPASRAARYDVYAVR